MHYTEYIDKIKNLLKNKDYKEAEKLLIQCVALTEKESIEKGWGVAPWYYERLAIIYGREKRYLDEVSILERYDKQKKAPGVKPAKLKLRLRKVKNDHAI